MYNAHRGSDLETVSLSRSPLQDTWSSTRVTHCAITTSILVLYVTPHESERFILDPKRLLRLKWPGNHLLSLLRKKITNFRTSDLSTPPVKMILAAETGHKLSEMPSGKCDGKNGRSGKLQAVSCFSLQSYCTRNRSMRITWWFAIALDEIRTRRILREKADCKQSSGVYKTWVSGVSGGKREAERGANLLSLSLLGRPDTQAIVSGGSRPSEIRGVPGRKNNLFRIIYFGLK